MAIPRHWFSDDARFAIKLAHVTVGGDRLSLVSTADPRLNIEDNQQVHATALATALGKPLEVRSRPVCDSANVEQYCPSAV